VTSVLEAMGTAKEIRFKMVDQVAPATEKAAAR
jgi:hypothetical protein